MQPGSYFEASVGFSQSQCDRRLCLPRPALFNKDHANDTVRIYYLHYNDHHHADKDVMNLFCAYMSML